MDKNNLIPFTEAFSQILSQIQPLGAEQEEILAAVDRVVAEDLIAAVDSPSADVSLKDGYAVISTDVEKASPKNSIVLHLAGEVAAGFHWDGELKRGQAVRILSGAPIPRGADAVLAEEFSVREGPKITALNDARAGRNILAKGSDVQKGKRLVSRGTTLFPQKIGLLAAAGIHEIPVIKRPKVGILACGDEVIAPGQPLLTGQLYASNLVTLAAWCQKFGFEVDMRVEKDDREKIRQSMAELLEKSDALLTSGGAWSSERDLILKILAELGWNEYFHRVRMGPGKAVGFGKLNAKPVFCLPGGPPSNNMAFLQLALPGLQLMAGMTNPGLSLQRVRVAERITGQKDWTQFIHGIITDESGHAEFNPIRQTSRLQMLSNTDGIVCIPEGQMVIEKGEFVMAQILA